MYKGQDLLYRDRNLLYKREENNRFLDMIYTDYA
jgi:hypothetical protein